MESERPPRAFDENNAGDMRASAAEDGPANEGPPRLSPTRPPSQPQSKPPKPRLIPAKPGTSGLRPKAPGGDSGQPQAINPEDALAQLRRKMSQVANEFAEGNLNRAQFYAIYARYNEQRIIVEQLVNRDPETDAWKQVVRPGHTSFLRQHFEARTLSLLIYPLGSPQPFVQYGKIFPKPKQVLPILKALPRLIKARGALGPAYKEVGDGRWLMLAPGHFTVSVVLFSLEPSAQQVTQIGDLHRDFERANIQALQAGRFQPERLVFPQRALFGTQSL